ncbi:MAG: hypothetical protein WD354_05725, partial [Acidimicrobiia bacterium]
VLLLVACSGLPSPPDLVVVAEDGEVRVAPLSYCWSDVDRGLDACATGTYPLSNPTNVGGVDGRIEFLWHVDGWRFEAGINDPGDQANKIGLAATYEGAGLWVLDPGARVGLQEVYISGRGPEGDVGFIFLAELSE